MRRRDWVQMDLQDRSGVSQKAISYILREAKCPTLDTVDALARAFGMPAWRLLRTDLRRELEGE